MKEDIYVHIRSVKWRRRKWKESHCYHHIEHHIITLNDILVASLQIYGYKILILSTLNVIMHQRKICFCHSGLLEMSTFVSSFFTFKNQVSLWTLIAFHKWPRCIRLETIWYRITFHADSFVLSLLKRTAFK